MIALAVLMFAAFLMAAVMASITSVKGFTRGEGGAYPLVVAIAAAASAVVILVFWLVPLIMGGAA